MVYQAFTGKQPPKSFVADLTRPMHGEIRKNWNQRKAAAGEIFLSSLSLSFSFPDPEGLLESSYKDFREFLKSAQIKEDGGLPLRLRQEDLGQFEGYSVEVSAKEICITAGDTEGIRRALIFLEDECIRREGAFLPVGKITRKPFLKTRISRCCFSPPSHNDNFGMENELSSEIDYYPEGYLNRLMHDGINGLWIGADFKDLLPSKIFPEYGKNSAKLVKKLNGIVERCRRYGIGVYLFSIEPASAYQNLVLQRRKELLGGKAWEGTLDLFCCSVPEFAAYIDESIKTLFSLVPRLKGFINITAGERLSGCGSSGVFTCEKCRAKFGSHAATLAYQERLFAEAVKKYSHGGEFISWTYSQRVWEKEAFEESLALRDEGVIHMQNFEDCGRQVQLGRERVLYDYWLAFVGPGELMKKTLSVNEERGISTYAKLQIATSFDFSSLPYVPAPGILYDKFSYMRAHGIEGALLCWYFGNYPGLMNKAACELAFEEFNGSKRAFLERLAGGYFGSSEAATVADGYEAFEEGYKNIPLNKAFEWFSPMVDASAVPLHLLPVDIPLGGAWRVDEPTSGDRVGDALLDGHTLEEAVLLAEEMRGGFARGLSKMESTKNTSLPCKDQRAVAAALYALTASGKNALRFYALRHRLGVKEDAFVLDEMEGIVKEERERSLSLAALCEEYPYLGYQAEANGFKFFKEKLLWRREELDKVLAYEFPAVRDRMAQGLAPLAFYLGEGARRYELAKEDCAPLLPFLPKEKGAPAHTYLSAYEKAGEITLQFTLEGRGDTLKIEPEFHLLHASAPFKLAQGRAVFQEEIGYGFVGEKVAERRRAFFCEYEETESGERYTLRFARSALQIEEGEPFRLAVTREGKYCERLGNYGKAYQKLIRGELCPAAYCFFLAPRAKKM